MTGGKGGSPNHIQEFYTISGWPNYIGNVESSSGGWNQSILNRWKDTRLSQGGGGYPGELIIRPTVFVIGLETDVNIGGISEIDGYWVAGTHPYYTHRHRLSVK